MAVKNTLVLFFIIFNIFIHSVVYATTEYRDSQGKVVRLPLGDISFADKVVGFKNGKPATTVNGYDEPNLALGPPDYAKGGKADAVALGCSGSLVLQFSDNALIDVEGPDLHVFEVGPDVEETNLAISKNGKQWIELGEISGGRAAIDIVKFTEAHDTFRFVKLTDMKSGCRGKFPGADIDAVAAVGSAIRLTLKGSVLFESDKSTLQPDAEQELDRAIVEIRKHKKARVKIEGHTDNRGSNQYNQRLSEDRTKTVRDYFLLSLSDSNYYLDMYGYGELNPIASNKTEESRGENRRVEIIIIPQ